jgi:branched-chain amino acid transport system ATP-binding protein
MNTPVVEYRHVTLSFSGVRALDDVSLKIDAGAVVGVIGPNGAGKTSLFNCLSGVYRPDKGSVLLDGADITRLPPQQIARRGVARTFQNLGLFEQMSVLDNLLVGRHHLFRTPWWSDILWTRRTRREEIAHRKKAEDVIDFLELEAYRRSLVGELPYGVRKRVELGRALCMDARVLLLDEPAAGLNQEERRDLARYLLDIKQELGLTQILIEHELRFVLDLTDQIAVLDFGRKIAEGAPAAIAADPRVSEAYTGGAHVSQAG